MRGREFRARDKKVQKLGRDGLVEQNKATGEERRVSQRTAWRNRWDPIRRKAPRNQTRLLLSGIHGAALPRLPLTTQYPSGGGKVSGIPAVFRRDPPTVRNHGSGDGCALRPRTPPLPLAEHQRNARGVLRSRRIKQAKRGLKMPAVQTNTANPRTQRRSRPRRSGFILRTHPRRKLAANCLAASRNGMKRQNGALNRRAGSWKRPKRRYPPNAAHIWRSSMTVQAARYAAAYGLRRSRFQKTQNPPSPSRLAVRWYGRRRRRRC